MNVYFSEETYQILKNACNRKLLLKYSAVTLLCQIVISLLLVTKMTLINNPNLPEKWREIYLLITQIYSTLSAEGKDPSTQPQIALLMEKMYFLSCSSYQQWPTNHPVNCKWTKYYISQLLSWNIPYLWWHSIYIDIHH